MRPFTINNRPAIILALAGCLLALPALADVNAEKVFDFSLYAGDSFDLSNVNGDVEVITGDAARVVATISASSQKYLDALEIKVDESANRISIDTKFPNNMRFGHAEVDYVITLPEGVELDRISTVNGDVDIDDRDGVIMAETVNGDIDANNLSGDVDLETVNGEIEVSFVALGGDDDIELETVNGSIRVSLPQNADVTINAENMNGGMDVNDVDILNHKQSKWTSNQSIEAISGNGSASLSADSVNGEIRIDRN